MKKRKTKVSVDFKTALKELLPEFKELIDLTNEKIIYHVGGRETLVSKNNYPTN